MFAYDGMLKQLSSCTRKKSRSGIKNFQKTTPKTAKLDNAVTSPGARAALRRSAPSSLQKGQPINQDSARRDRGRDLLSGNTKYPSWFSLMYT